MTLFQRLKAALREAWEVVWSVHQYVSRARFSACFGILSVIVFGLVSQGREVLRVLVQRTTLQPWDTPEAETFTRALQHVDWPRLTWLMSATVFFSYTCWALARVLMSERLVEYNELDDPVGYRTARDMPSLFGALPFLAIGCGFAQNTYPESPDTPLPLWLRLFGPAAMIVLLAVVPLCLIYLKRKTPIPQVDKNRIRFNISILVAFGLYALGAFVGRVRYGNGTSAFAAMGFFLVGGILFGFSQIKSTLLFVAIFLLSGSTMTGQFGSDQVVPTLFLFFLTLGWSWLTHGAGLRTVSPRGAALANDSPAAGSTVSTQWMLGATTMATVILFTGMTLVGESISVRIGTASILGLGFGVLVLFGSLLILYTGATRFPLLLAVVVWVAICSLFMDNHDVPVLDSDVSRQAEQSPRKWRTIGDAFLAWVDWIRSQDVAPSNDALATQQPTEREHMVFIVAAEGGGIRAAYWTAMVLGALDDASSGDASPLHFSSHCFAISGVSGGSVGAMMYASLLAADHPDRANTLHGILSQDLLAPAVNQCLFGDLLQRFIPYAFPRLDRGRVIERAWSRAFDSAQTSKPGLLQQPFLKLYEGVWSKDGRHVPLLFLNCTEVESGQRVIFSPIQPDDFRCAEFHEAICGHGELLYRKANAAAQARDLPLASAAHNSARFTYVSPAGRLPTNRRVVDGGYFENSGATTALDIALAVQSAIRNR